MSEKVVRTADLTEAGADALFDFIAEFHENEGKNQALLEVETDDGIIVEAAELIAETFGGETTYRLRLKLEAA